MRTDYELSRVGLIANQRRRSGARRRSASAPAAARADAGVALQLSWHALGAVSPELHRARSRFTGRGRLEVALLPGGPNAPVEPPVGLGARAGRHLGGRLHRRRRGNRARLSRPGFAIAKNPFVVASLPAKPESVNEPLPDLVGKRSAWRWRTPVLQALCTLNGVDVDGIEDHSRPQYSAQPSLFGTRSIGLACCWTDLPVAMAIEGITAHPC